MPRKSRRPVQRGDPTLDRRTWRPPTGRVARAATASEASATARKTPKKAKEPKIGLLQLLHFATPLDYICLSIAVPCAAWTGFLQVTRTTPPPPLAVNTRGNPSPCPRDRCGLIAASRQSFAVPLVFTTPQTTSALRPSSAGLDPLHLRRAARLAGLYLGGVDREIREARPHSRTPGFQEVARDRGTVALEQHSLTDAPDTTRRKPCCHTRAATHREPLEEKRREQMYVV